jgi:hypothetical protein
MKKLRLPRRLAFFPVAVAMAALLAGPASALAETGTESAGAPEPSPPAEGSTPPVPGWVPQDEAAEDTADAVAPTRRGSALGSGGGSTQQPATEEPPATVEQPVPTPAASDSYEPEASSPAAIEEPEGTPQAAPAVDPEPQAEAPANLAVGSADPIARAASPQVSAGFVPSVEARPVGNTTGQAAAGASGLLWPALIVGLMIFLYAGARLLLGPVELDIFRSGPFRRVRGY